VKLWARRGDNAQLSVLELVQEAYAPRPKKAKVQPPAATAAPVEAAPQEAPVVEAVAAEAEAPEG
jgi:hypothetical protein